MQTIIDEYVGQDGPTDNNRRLDPGAQEEATPSDKEESAQTDHGHHAPVEVQTILG